MTDAPPLHAYLVAGLTSDGALFVNSVVANSPERATAQATMDFMSALGRPAELTGIVAQQISAEFLRAALHAIESGAGAAQVLSLVPKAATPDPEVA